VTELQFCIPVYNDWTAAMRMLALLDMVLAGREETLRVLLVDDGSSEPAPAQLPFRPKSLHSVDVLPLRRNLGHQRAIAIGLTYLYVQRPSRAVVVMDADGEDAPADVQKLLEECARQKDAKMVFAQRARRSEGFRFWAGYQLYKALHRLLTGRRVEVGNFSVVPWALLERLVGVSEVWNHYPAAVFKARIPVAQVPLPRAVRLAGESKMNWVSLVAHGLSAISVQGEIVGVRLVCLAAGLIALSFLALVGVGAALFLSPGALPPWATTAAVLLCVLLVGLFSMLTLPVLFVLQARERYSFLPLRDYQHYVLPEKRLQG
jgi:hypothetical protein